jgi:O-antigen biosynthesis protein WbqP
LFYNIVKKIFDFAFSIILLIVLFPLFIIISLLVFFETGQAPFFIQERGLSLTNKRFRIYKFRTLKNNPHKIPAYNPSFLQKRNEEGLVIYFGKFLRKTGLDELPQLVNILKGEMSFIGPRPLDLRDLETMKEFFPEYYIRRDELKIKPGLSGLWQLNKGDDYSIKNLGTLEEIYLKKRSLIFDTILFFKSMKIVITASNHDAVV